MDTSIDPRVAQTPGAPVKCAVCAIEVPLDEAVVPEVADRLVYLCGLDCYARWRVTALASFSSQLPEPR
jgi:hypothetical protein